MPDEAPQQEDLRRLSCRCRTSRRGEGSSEKIKVWADTRHISVDGKRFKFYAFFWSMKASELRFGSIEFGIGWMDRFNKYMDGWNYKMIEWMVY